MAGVKDYEPYLGNTRGLVDVLIDFKSTMPTPIVYKIVGFNAVAFEDVTQGDALYSRTSDGKLGKAIANDTFDKAFVAGIAETTKSAGESVRCIVAGVVATTWLDAGDEYYLSNASAGAITKTAPTTATHYVTRIGESVSTTQLIARIERPIKLD